MNVLRLRPSCSHLYVERLQSMSDVRDRVRVRGRECLAIISVTGHTVFTVSRQCTIVCHRSLVEERLRRCSVNSAAKEF